MARLVGFEPDPEYEGLGTARFDDGSDMYTSMADIQGSGLQLPPMPDQRLASNGGAGGMPGYGSAAGQSPEQISGQLSADPVQLAPPPVQAPAQQPVQAPVEQPMPEPEPPPAITAPQQPAMDPYAPVYQPGSAGVDPQQMIRDGVKVPTTGSTVREGGFAPEVALRMARGQSDAHDAQQAATLALAQSRVARNNAEAEGITAQNRVLQNQAVDLEADRMRAEADFTTKRQAMEADLETFSKEKLPDPGRYFKNKGVFAQIGAALAQGLGAYAAIVGGGGRNFAQEIISKQIDDDIRAQETEYKEGRADRRNSIARYVEEQGMTVEQAKATAKAAAQGVALGEARKFQLLVSSEEEQLAADKMVADQEMDYQKSLPAMQAQFMGKETETVNNRVMQPERGSAGGFRAPSEKEIGQRLDNRKKAGEQGLVSDYIDAPALAAKDKDAKASREKLGQAMSEGNFAGYRTVLETTVKKLGAVLNKQSGLYEMPENNDLAGIGPLDETGRSIKRAFNISDTIQQSLDNVLDAQSRIRSGAVVGDEERASMEKILFGNKSEEEVLHGLNSFNAELSAKANELEKGYGPEAVKQGDRNARDVREYRANKPRPTPRAR